MDVRREDNMVNACRFDRTVLKKYFWPAILAAGIVPAPMLSGDAAGASKNDRASRLLTAVPIPGTSANTTGGNLYVFDISWVDQNSRTYYLADRSNAVVDIVDTTTSILLAQLSGGFKGFTGNN